MRNINKYFLFFYSLRVGVKVKGYFYLLLKHLNLTLSSLIHMGPDLIVKCFSQHIHYYISLPHSFNFITVIY